MDCHATATHHFCPKCGQKTRSPRGHFRVLIADFFNSWLGADAKLWPTIWRLFRHPGALTLDYREGRRTRYLSPLKIYFFFTILFFLSLSLTPNHGAIFSHSVGKEELTAQELEALATNQGESESMLFREGVTEIVPWKDSWLGSAVHERLMVGATRLDQMPIDQANRVVADHIYANLPVGLFLCLPIIALALRVVFWRSSQIYFDHFIFTLHSVAFFFGGILTVRIVGLLPWIEILYPGFVLVFVIWLPVYFLRALKVSTGRGYLGGIATGIWMILVLFPTIIATLLGLVLFGILQA